MGMVFSASALARSSLDTLMGRDRIWAGCAGVPAEEL
jgi:hypothetical protein